MQFNSIVLTLTIFSAAFVSAIPVSQGSGSDAGILSTLLGVTAAGPSQQGSKSFGPQQAAGIIPQINAENIPVLNGNTIGVDPQAGISLLSSPGNEFAGLVQKTNEKAHNGDNSHVSSDDNPENCD